MRHFITAALGAALGFWLLSAITTHINDKYMEAKSYADRLLVETNILKP